MLYTLALGPSYNKLTIITLTSKLLHNMRTVVSPMYRQQRTQEQASITTREYSECLHYIRLHASNPQLPHFRPLHLLRAILDPPLIGVAVFVHACVHVSVMGSYKPGGISSLT